MSVIRIFRQSMILPALLELSPPQYLVDQVSTDDLAAGVRQNKAISRNLLFDFKNCTIIRPFRLL